MQNVTLWGETLRYLVEVSATIAFALSGILEGARRRLDPVGVTAVGLLAAFGGGTLRDLLLDQRPFFWVRHVELLWAVLVLGALCMLLLRARHVDPTERAMQWPDALGLGLFTANGTHIALVLGLPGVVAVLMGVITGVAGGVLRDVVCSQIPSAFRDHRPYAVCAFAGGWLYVGLWQLDTPGWLSLLACLLLTAGLRGLALWRDWHLPEWRL